MRFHDARSFIGTPARRPTVIVGLLALAATASAAVIPNLFPFLDPTGVVSTYNTAGAIDQTSPFFQSLGTNGRSCATCHVAGNAFGLGVQNIQARFAATAGSDPLFAPVDGANCPNSTVGGRASHSLLLNNGLIRISLPVPVSAQFTIAAVSDPYGCAIVTDPTSGQQSVSVYRRPLPATNLRFLSTVMVDGRETIVPLNNPATFQANLIQDLMHQAVDATTGHAQGNPPTVAQQTAIVNFELGLSSAQIFDNNSGPLFADKVQGGPVYLPQQQYYPGINDSLGGDPTGAGFNPAVFSLFAPWANLRAQGSPDPSTVAARQAIAAGENIFNTHPLFITDVRGLNDNAKLGSPASIAGTCSTCHDAPNIGNHSLPLPLDIGTGHDLANETDPQLANGLSQLSFPGVPVYAIRGCPNPFPNAQDASEPYVIYTTDPGKALITGLCSDVNRIKGPILRGLAARAPYFHNGSAQNLTELVNFYNQRFQMNLTDREKAQLIAFLNAL